jgi:hypothetical protein
MEAQPIGMVLAFATFVVTGTLTTVPLESGHIALLILGLLWWAMGVEYLQRIGRLRTSHIIAGLHLCNLLVAWVLLIGPLLPALSHGSSIPLALFDLVFLFWLWRRSLSRARSGFTYDALARSFKVGLSFLLLVMVLAMLASQAQPLLTELEGGMTVFFLSGFITLSLTRLGIIRQTRYAHGQQADPTRFWLAALTGLSSLLIVLVLILEALFSYESFLVVVGALSPFWNLLGTLLGWLLYAVVFLVFAPIFNFLSWLIHRIGPASAHLSTPHPPVSPFAHQAHTHPTMLPPFLFVAGQWLALVLVACLLVLLIKKSLQRWFSSQDEMPLDETRERLETGSLLRERWQDWWTRLCQHQSDRAPALEPDSARAYYRQLLQAVAMSRPEAARRPIETPVEYEPRLLAQVQTPSNAGELGEPSTPALLHTLTVHYLRERYGQQALDHQQRTFLRTWVPYLIKKLTRKPSV